MLELENSFLEHTVKLISVEKLKVQNFKQSRYRSGFLELASKALADFHKNMQEIRTGFMEKDEEGNFIWAKDEEGNELKDQFVPDQMLKTDEDTEKFYKEVNILINEKVVLLEDTETHKRIFDAMAEVLEDPKELELETDGDEFLYNLLCKRFKIEL